MKLIPRAGLCLLLAGLAGQTTQAQVGIVDAGAEWPSYNNHLDGQRFSPLKQITPANVAKLGEVCRVQVDGPTSFHSDLVLVQGVIYAATGRETVAIDATTCKLRWHHTWTPQEDHFSPSSRGVAVMDGRVFRGTGDGRLLALDAATGKVLWTDIIGVPRLGENAVAAPLAANGVVYMGIAGSELGVRGRVLAFDAVTGRELWRFNTVPVGNEPGADSWKRPESAKTGGGGVWGAMSLDVGAGELLVSVGNPWPDIDKGYRPGDNLYTDSLVVLDARTGALKWWHQLSANDWMDLDLVAPAVVYRDSQVRDIVAIGGKDGFVTAVDRDSHKVLFHTAVTTVGPTPDAATPAGVNSCPGYAGGVEWNGPALDTANSTLVVGAVDACFKVTLGKTEYSPGEASFGGSVEPYGPTTGWITSVDAGTGAVRWKYHAEKPVVAGITPTAGGVTFAGDLGGNLLIFNSRSGELLRKVQTGGSLAGGLITYEIGGRQYLAFADGNVSRNAFGALGLPSIVIMTLSPARPATSLVSPGALMPVAASVPAGQDTTPIGGAAANTGASTGTANGQRLYQQVCSACHGGDGNMIPDHRLSTLKSRMDHTATVAFIKHPKAPMPQLYPQLLKDRDVTDITTYLERDIVK